MSRTKGEVGIKQIILLCFAIGATIIVLIFLFVLLSNFIYGACWSQPKKDLTNLQNGDNTVDFRGCVGKVIFVDLSGFADKSITAEVDIYECDKYKDRMKGYGSFIIMIPAKGGTGFFDYLKNPLKTYQKDRLKTTCIWRSYGVYQKVVFEGADEQHCIHVEDYRTNPVIKNIAPCVTP